MVASPWFKEKLLTQTILSFFFIITSFFYTAHAQELRAMQAYTVHYDVLRDGDKLGTADRKLEKLTNGQWQLSMSSTIRYLFFKDKRQETSRFEVINALVTPIQYQRLSDSNLKSDTTLVQNFNWQTLTESGSYKGNQWNLAIKPGVLDQLTQLLPIRERLLQQKPITNVEISYRGSIRLQQFKVVSQEKITTPQGIVDCAKVQLTEKEGRRITNFWFTLDDKMLPIKIQRIKDGEEEAQLVATSWN